MLNSNFLHSTLFCSFPDISAIMLFYIILFTFFKHLSCQANIIPPTEIPGAFPCIKRRILCTFQIDLCLLWHDFHNIITQSLSKYLANIRQILSCQPNIIISMHQETDPLHISHWTRTMTSSGEFILHSRWCLVVLRGETLILFNNVLFDFQLSLKCFVSVFLLL